ncbi:MAG TPA: MtrB/PioB family outer membrane beta-barrel protein [Terriglobales bacterium]|jgi:MtrB/PioB family decaheme-associated outer membrane protein|nr:MtrB/PioB family outer membrane beta-barrel protein [Terriglobales bacterium]
MTQRPVLIVGIVMMFTLQISAQQTAGSAVQNAGAGVQGTAAQAGSNTGQTTNPAKPNAASEPAAEVESPVSGHNMVEFGVRNYWGNVYGRPDLPFNPNLRTSKLNEYSDIRNNFIVRRARVNFEDVLGTHYYVNYQTQSTLYRNQSHLATFGEWNLFKLQFRYDEIPHIYSNTTRILYTQTGPGVYTIPLIVRQSLQIASSTGTAAQINNSLPSFVATQVIPSEQFFVPQSLRRAGTAAFTYNLTPKLNFFTSFWREHQSGSRPIGTILNSSPSAGGSSSPGSVPNRQSPGVAAELPEPIDYFSNTVRGMAEYTSKTWGAQLGYVGSFLQSNVKSMLFDSPFATADLAVQIIPPGGGCVVTAPAQNCSIGAVPAHGQMALYPDNQAHYLHFATAFDVGKYIHVMGLVMPGWLRQNDAFLPYTANTAITGLPALPASSLNGQKQTLAMNWTAIAKLTKRLQLEAKYRHYDYNNDTGVLTLTPIQGDTIGANAAATAQAAPTPTDTNGRSNPGYNRKTLEFSGDYFFTQRSAVRAGWIGEWLDRSHRDAGHSFEKSFFGTVDYTPVRSLLIRISGRHADRKPDEYQDDTASDPNTGVEISCTSTSTVFTQTQRCARRFDEAARIQDRGDVLAQYDVGNFSLAGSFTTMQNDYNRRSGVNSPTALNFVSGTTNPYYLYGLLKDLAWTYSFDGSYALNPNVSMFAEYTRDHYHTRMISRSRTPTSGTQTILTCSGCDSANNDWESITRDINDTYAAGLDLYFRKRIWFSPYYSLAAGKNNVFSRALGDPTITTGPNKFVLTGASAAEDYPEVTTRIHEAVAVVKFKLSDKLFPKLEYRYQQFDNRDYQTTPMTPYMGCVGAGTIVVSSPCVNLGATTAGKVPSPFYPGFVVGDTAAARYVFLGADQPSYHAHIITATLEYHF